MTGLPIVPPLVALVLFAAWGLLLVIAIGMTRLVQVVTQGKGPGDFPAGTPHGSPGYWRLNRAHLNVTENLPFFGALCFRECICRCRVSRSRCCRALCFTPASPNR